MILQNTYQYTAEVKETGKQFKYAKREADTKRLNYQIKGFGTGKKRTVIETPYLPENPAVYDLKVNYNLLLLTEGLTNMKIANISKELTNEMQLMTVGYDAADKVMVLELE